MVSVVPRLDECPARADPLLDASDCLLGTAARLASGLLGVLAVQALRQETASAAAKAAGASRLRNSLKSATFIPR